MECMVFKARIGNVISIQFNFTNQSNYYGILKCIDHHLENELPDMLTDTSLFLNPHQQNSNANIQLSTPVNLSHFEKQLKLLLCLYWFPPSNNNNACQY